MTLNEVCDRLQDFLQKWYDWKVGKNQKKLRSLDDIWVPSDEVVDPFFDYSFGENRSPGSISGVGLSGAKDEFVGLWPESREFMFDLIYDFKIVPGSQIAGNPSCGNGCCSPWDYAKVCGVWVEPIDWEEIRKEAGL